MSADDRTTLMPEEELQALLDQASALTPDEVVTHVLSRDIALPHTGRTAVLITLDNGDDHTRPNTLGPAQPRRAERGDRRRPGSRRRRRASLITGKPFILAAGADLRPWAGLTGVTRRQAIARIGHAVFDKLHTSPVPTFAFINGLALGGGLEVGLHCALPHGVQGRGRASRCPSASSVCSPAGAAPTCCPT